MENKILLWLDDVRNPLEETWENYIYQHTPIGYMPLDIVWVKSYNEFIEWISNHSLPAIISFDHDLGKDIETEARNNGMSKRKARSLKKGLKTGMDCAKWLIEYCLDNNKQLPKWHVHSYNPVGKENIQSILYNFQKHQNRE